MDLQIERRLEQFLKLLDLPCARISERMAFMHAHARLLIEIVDGRFALSLASTVHVSQGRDAFIRLLEHCDPMRMHGLSLHAFLARDQLVLGCVFPRHTSIDDWIRYYRLMSRLLNNHIRGAT